MNCIASLKAKGWYFCLKELRKRVFPFWFVSDNKIGNLILENRAYAFLKRKYLPLLGAFRNCGAASSGTKRIWVCWLQGEDQAPAIVKSCISSIRKHSAGLEVTVITNENLESYVEVPEYITGKLHNRQMQFAQYTDYLRLCLLAKYGGIWIDATVFLTADIPSDIYKLPLFCFQSSVLSPSPSKLSSWFLAAEPANPVILKVKYLMEEYWKRERHLCNYYLFHLLFSVVVNEDPEANQIWTKVPYYNNSDVHLLQFSLFEQYDEQQADHFKRLAFAHKLTYKFADPKKKDIPSTYYQHIISGQL